MRLFGFSGGNDQGGHHGFSDHAFGNAAEDEGGKDIIQSDRQNAPHV
jgi:hypothetical protein